MGQGKEDDTERAARLRDNKRRHRQRQREYVADLERRLAESRADGIQATKEVQAAARRVVWENTRLRQILQDQGLNSDAIESLIYKDGPYVPDDKPCLRGAQIQPGLHRGEACEQPGVDSGIDTGLASSPPAELPQPQVEPDSTVRSTEICPTKSPPEDSSPPPCKILTILAGNPGADITQLPAPTNGDGACEEPDGVECLRAREVLMSYATSEKKLDEISQTLEKSCVKNKSGGGCHVKKDVLWSALDRIM